MDLNSSPLAYEFVVGGLIDVLEATPTAYIAYQDRFKWRVSSQDIQEERLKALTFIQCKAAFSNILVRTHNPKSMLSGILARNALLLFDRARLETGGDPYVFCYRMQSTMGR